MTARSTFDRIAACGGVAFAVLALSTVVIAPPPPALDASAADIREYLADNSGRFGASTAVMVLAVLAVAAVFGYVHRRLAEKDEGTAAPGVFQTAAAATVTLALAGALLQGLLARHSAGFDDATLLAAHRTYSLIAFAGPPLPLTVALLVAAERTLRSGVFPRWTGWVALVSAAGGLTTALINVSTSTTSPPVLDFGSFLLSCVWFTGISVSAFLTPRVSPATA
ncbi:hypothetical protein AB0M28_10040 [Streptomyces sp. NPDC051940]|uniref:hypothetical protein n=1 Tax=Streptomyces sp. NPDC051940 TaxID=3155675 RepID=UPI00343FD304